MAKERPKPRTRKKKASRKTDMTVQLLKILGGLAMLVFLVVSAGALAYVFIKTPLDRPEPSGPPAAVAAKPPVAPLSAPPPVKALEKPAYEVFPQKDTPPRPLPKLAPLPGDIPPLVAIIIDDIGYDRQIASQLLSLDAPLTFAMLPHGPFSRRIMYEARSKGHEIMLHLPMEPREYPEINPGPGALLEKMTPDQMIDQLENNLAKLPGLKGVNNHMGSRLSASPERMRQIFSILKKHDLYYIDSRTTAETVARPSARLLQVRFAERDIFIDHFDDPVFIRGQLKKLIKRAQRQGYAIGIAHPHQNTYQALEAFLPLLKAKVKLAPASLVVESAMVAETDKKQAAR